MCCSRVCSARRSARLALRVDRHADEAARHLALEFVTHREIRGVRAAEAHRHAKALRVADRDVRTPVARRREHGQREQVRCDDHVAAGRVDRFGERAVVAHVAVHARVLQQHAERIRLRGVGGRAGLDLDADRQRARADHFERLRQHVVGDVEHVRRRLAGALQQRHRFGGGGGFVEQRRVRDREAGEVGDHLLEVQERLEATLGNFGLVRRVGRVPRRVFEHVAQDHGRRVRVVVTLTDIRAEHLVLVRENPQRGEASASARFGCANGPSGSVSARRIEAGITASIRAARREAERVEHGLLAGGVGADVAFGERVVRFERGERRGVRFIRRSGVRASWRSLVGPGERCSVRPEYLRSTRGGALTPARVPRGAGWLTRPARFREISRSACCTCQRRSACRSTRRPRA